MKSSTTAFSPNDRINHSIYGLGTISEVNDLHTVIEFDGNGRRKFVTSIVRLERTDIVAPARPTRKGRSKTVKSISRTKAEES